MREGVYELSNKDYYKTNLFVFKDYYIKYTDIKYLLRCSLDDA